MKTADNVLVRKLRSGGVARSPLPDTDFVGQTFARQIEEKLRPLVKATVSAMVLECRIEKLIDSIRRVPVPAMLGLIKVEDAKIQGIVNIDSDLTFHLIDLMLGGDPSVASRPTARTFTAIDLALCRIPLDAVVAAFVAALESCFSRPMTNKMSIVGQRQDITQVRFTSDRIDVLVYNISLGIGEAARTGNLQFFLPLATLDVIYAATKGEAVEAPDERSSDLWSVQMRNAAAKSPIVVNAVLHRQHLTIAALQDLKPGDILEIPHNAPEDVQLLIRQPGGKAAQVASGQLGAYQGCKVVKLATPIDQRVRDHIQRVL